MDARTRTYLAGRFRDHYRRVAVSPPPTAHRREWGYIPWSEEAGTTMIRHRSLADLGEIDQFLERTHPRHVYYSAGRYRDPAAGRMGEKGWRGADLIFDLDADHLPGVNPDEDSYADMLAACKTELEALLSHLREDFGFQDLDVVFSGGRGYHVHVRDDSVLELDREARREIVDYIRGHGVSLESILETALVAGAGRETPAERRHLDPDRGWSRRIHRELMAEVESLRTLEKAQAIERLLAFEGIGAKKAEAIHRAMTSSFEQIVRGNIDVHPGFLTFVDAMVSRAITQQRAAIDEPVTTDVNRLIRLPGSLHGGSGLAVRPIPLDGLDLFDPLAHAIPETFRDREIAIDITEEATVEMADRTFELPPGLARVPEYLGIHLLTTERACKVRERRI